MTATQVRTAVIVEALRLACRAPSLHNSQPWRWVLTDDAIDLFADPERLIGGTDEAGRAALLSCGAVLDHFRVAMAAAGWDTPVTRFPSPDDPLHLARIGFATAQLASADRGSLADAILVRYTDRLPFAEPPDAEALMHTLAAVADDSTVRLNVVDGDGHGLVAEASELAAALRRYDAEYHYELRWWTADFVADDGIPTSSLISAAERDRVRLGRVFPTVTHTERRPNLTDDRSTILVLSTLDDSRESILHCGEVLSTVLLEATTVGLATCTLTHITEIPQGRDVIASLVGSEAIPQVLVRVGQAPALEAAPPPTPRRPVERVLRNARERAC